MEEEIGIKIDIVKLEPFACAIGYYKEYPREGSNHKIEIYYYEIVTDINSDFNNLNLTENEKEGNFELKYVPLNDMENELKNNIDKYSDPHGITRKKLELLYI